MCGSYQPERPAPSATPNMSIRLFFIALALTFPESEATLSFLFSKDPSTSWNCTNVRTIHPIKRCIITIYVAALSQAIGSRREAQQRYEDQSSS
jgi:hypothetical protein